MSVKTGCTIAWENQVPDGNSDLPAQFYREPKTTQKFALLLFFFKCQTKVCGVDGGGLGLPHLMLNDEKGRAKLMAVFLSCEVCEKGVLIPSG